MPVLVRGDECSRHGVDAEVVRPVVLDDEGPMRRHDVEHLGPLLHRPLLAGRVGVVGLGVEDARTRRRERGVEVDGAWCASGARDGNDHQPRLARGRDRTPVGRRLHHDRLARSGDRPHRRGERGLPARGDHDVGVTPTAGTALDPGKLAHEPATQLRNARDRRSRECLSPSRHTTHRCRDRFLR